MLHCLDNSTYIKYATAYAGCKRWGVRGIYTFLGGTGLLQIKLKLIEAISTIPLKKVFYVEVFLDQFNISTSKRSIIKNDIVKVFNQLQTHGIIKNHYTLIKKSQQIHEVDTSVSYTHLTLPTTSRV